MPRVYHTCASRGDLERARRVAPELDHGFGAIPRKMTAVGVPWFLDNGAYRAWQAGEPPIPPAAFWERLEQIEARMPRPPEFVVLPDVPGSADTIDHAAHYLNRVRSFGYPYYLPIHPGMPAEWQVRIADRWDCAGVMLGGAFAWVREVARTVVSAARTRGLNVHVGRPEWAARWMLEVGIDSVNTSGFAETIIGNRVLTGRGRAALTSPRAGPQRG